MFRVGRKANFIASEMQLIKELVFMVCILALMGNCLVRPILCDEIALTGKRTAPTPAGMINFVLRAAEPELSRKFVSGMLFRENAISSSLRLRGGAAKAAGPISDSAPPAKGGKVPKGAKAGASKEESQEAPKAKSTKVAKAASKTTTSNSASDSAPATKAAAKPAAKSKSKEKSQDAYSVSGTERFMKFL